MGVLLDDNEYWCNIWRKTDLFFQKWPEEFSQFSPEHVWKSKNWDFDGILLSKVENLWSRNLKGSFVSWQWKMIQNLKRNWLVNSKLTWEIWQILTRALENPKNLHFNRPLLTRVCNTWAKKSIEELCLVTLKLMQNLKETGLCFLKFLLTGWIVISFYKVKWQNLLKAELTDSLWKLPGCSQFSRVGIGWWTLL